LSSEEHPGPEKSFVEQARLAKKQKIKFEFERKDYIVSLRRTIDAIGSKCTICIVEKHSIISGHDHVVIVHWDTNIFLFFIYFS